MRQVAAAESSSIPQQLLLGGTFVTKRGPRDGSAGKAANGSAQSVEKASPVQAVKVPIDPDDDDSLDEPATEVVQSGRGRKAAVKAQPKVEAKATKGANGLHSRLQARLQNATFRETAREERETARQAERQAAREEKKRISAGKALLLDLDNALKQPKSKRAAQASEALEEQLRLIALRVGTQRVREIMDDMEELARRA
jgi:hypothetical protein